MTESPLEVSERLSNTRMQRFTRKIHRFCIKNHLPRTHGCVWDGHCQHWGGPNRIETFWLGFSFEINLPSKTFDVKRPSLRFRRNMSFAQYRKFRSDYLTRFAARRGEDGARI